MNRANGRVQLHGNAAEDEAGHWGVSDLSGRSGARAVRTHPLVGDELRRPGGLSRLVLSDAVDKGLEMADKP